MTEVTFGDWEEEGSNCISKCFISSKDFHSVSLKGGWRGGRVGGVGTHQSKYCQMVTFTQFWWQVYECYFAVFSVLFWTLVIFLDLSEKLLEQ